MGSKDFKQDTRAKSCVESGSEPMSLEVAGSFTFGITKTSQWESNLTRKEIWL